jgi:two-component system LytT family response regulator
MFTVININRITHVESTAHKLTYFMMDGIQHHEYKRLNDVEGVFIPCGFIRCHQSFLVNSRCVYEIARFTLLLSCGEVIPVSRERFTTIINTLTNRETEAL